MLVSKIFYCFDKDLQLFLKVTEQFKIFLLFSVLGIKPGTSHVLGEYSVTELHSTPTGC